jgi:hypothetical protein
MGLAGAMALCIHLGLLAVLAIHAGPMSVRDYGDDALQVALVPPLYLVKSRASAERRRPPRLRPRPARHASDASPVAPLYATPDRAPSTAAPSPQPPVRVQDARADLARALRGGRVGCANPEAAGLDPTERQLCLDQLGAGAKASAFLSPPLTADKRDRLDRAAHFREACRMYHTTIEAPMPRLRDGVC